MRNPRRPAPGALVLTTRQAAAWSVASLLLNWLSRQRWQQQARLVSPAPECQLSVILANRDFMPTACLGGCVGSPAVDEHLER